MGGVDTRAERIAHNQADFRDLNEGLQGGLGLLAGAADLVGFRCECGNPDCSQVVRVTLVAYEAVRRNPARFITLPGHEIPDVERVVERHAGHVVLEKHAPAATVTEARDPRS